jgi:hypothetical protein
MPANRIDEALRSLIPEPVICWLNGQSLESRYSSSGGAGGIGGAIGKAILRRQLGKARLPGAVRMPRASLVAVGAEQVYLFDLARLKAGPFATLPREQVRVARSGHMWKRLDLIADQGQRPQVFTIMVLIGGKRLRSVIAELDPHQGA